MLIKVIKVHIFSEIVLEIVACLFTFINSWFVSLELCTIDPNSCNRIQVSAVNANQREAMGSVIEINGFYLSVNL